MYSDRIIIFALARLSLRAAFIITLILPMLVAAPEAAAQNKPNIVFILTDDVDWGDLKPFNPNSQLNLPTIETLAAEGIVFTDAHTSAAKCAPSRYSIISGNYQWRGRFGWGQWNTRAAPRYWQDRKHLVTY
jgi:arylsulfatase A-like enzyme